MDFDGRVKGVETSLAGAGAGAVQWEALGSRSSC